MTTSQRILYVAIMACSLVVGSWLSKRSQNKALLTRPQRLAVAIGAIVGGTFAAKLPFFVMDPAAFASGAAWLEGGRTLTLGLVGGYFGVEAAKLSMGITVKTGDGFVVPVAAAIAIGRLGCFVGGCCFGTPTHLPWGVDFGDGVHRHPTQLYEALFHASCALFFSWAGTRGLFPRQRVKIYIIAYFVYRFVTEAIRPEPAVLLGLSFYQWTAIVFIPLFALLYARDRRLAVAPPATPEPGARA